MFDGYHLGDWHFNSLIILNMELLQVSEQMGINAAKLKQFRASITGVIFSGVLADYYVLQRAPAFASLYGAADTPNTK